MIIIDVLWRDLRNWGNVILEIDMMERKTILNNNLERKDLPG